MSYAGLGDLSFERAIAEVTWNIIAFFFFLLYTQKIIIPVSPQDNVRSRTFHWKRSNNIYINTLY